METAAYSSATTRPACRSLSNPVPFSSPSSAIFREHVEPFDFPGHLAVDRCRRLRAVEERLATEYNRRSEESPQPVHSASSTKRPNMHRISAGSASTIAAATAAAAAARASAGLFYVALLQGTRILRMG